MSGLPALVVAALADIYPELNRVIQEHATEEGKVLLQRLHKMTTAEAVIRMAKKDMGDMVDQPLEQILGTPEVQQIFDDIKLGVAVPTPPVLIVQAVHDQIISVEDIDELADTYSAGGASVTYHRDMFSEHMLLHPMSAPMTLRWLTDRFHGKPLDEHLVRTKWPTLLNPMTYVGMARLAKIAAKVDHWSDGRALSTVTGGGRTGSTGGQPPRSSRDVATAISAYVSAAIAAGNRIDAAINNGVCAKNTGGASVT